MVKVGLVMRPVTPSPAPRPWVKAVLPAPISPVSSTRSPGRASSASAAASVRVGVDRRRAGVDHRGVRTACRRSTRRCYRPALAPPVPTMRMAASTARTARSRTRSTGTVRSSDPVAAATMASPSTRVRVVPAPDRRRRGRSGRRGGTRACRAGRWSRSLPRWCCRSRGDFPRVAPSRLWTSAAGHRIDREVVDRGAAPVGTGSMSPNALTATRVDTTRSPSRLDAVPSPPARVWSGHATCRRSRPCRGPRPSGRGDPVRVGPRGRWRIGPGEVAASAASRAATPSARQAVPTRPRRGDRTGTSRRRSAPDRHRWGSPSPLGEVVHHPAGGGQPERGAPAQEQRIDPLDEPLRLQQRELPRRRRTAAHLARRDRALGEHHTAHPVRAVASVPCPTATPCRPESFRATASVTARSALRRGSGAAPGGRGRTRSRRRWCPAPRPSRRRR